MLPQELGQPRKFIPGETLGPTTGSGLRFQIVVGISRPTERKTNPDPFGILRAGLSPRPATPPCPELRIHSPTGPSELAVFGRQRPRLPVGVGCAGSAAPLPLPPRIHALRWQPRPNLLPADASHKPEVSGPEFSRSFDASRRSSAPFSSGPTRHIGADRGLCEKPRRQTPATGGGRFPV